MLMDFVDSGGVSTSVHVTTHGSSSIPASTFTQDAMWQLNLRSPQTMEYVSYPERPGEQDCSYYMRTGMCRFGATCRFNHPPNRTMIIENTRLNGEFPERVGQPECQYYLKTGTCKFGPTCKFHHPREKAGIAGRVTLNVLGYPIRTFIWRLTFHYGRNRQPQHTNGSNVFTRNDGIYYPCQHPELLNPGQSDPDPECVFLSNL